MEDRPAVSTPGTDVVVNVSAVAAVDWRTALTNLGNVCRSRSAPTRPSDLSVVVNGDAVRFVRAGAPGADRLRRATTAGVDVAACRNDMQDAGVSHSSLGEGVEVVAAGVAELARLQTDGTGYRKLP